MTKRKKEGNASKKIKQLDRPEHKKQAKEIYPKGMSIRYSKEQELEIFEMQQKMGYNTMSKAFLKAPSVIKEQHKELIECKQKIEQQRQKIRQLSDIVNSWQIFSKKLEDFVNKKEVTKMIDDESYYENGEEEIYEEEEDEEEEEEKGYIESVEEEEDGTEENDN